MKITVLFCFNSPVVLVKIILHEDYSNSVPISSIKRGRSCHQNQIHMYCKIWPIIKKRYIFQLLQAFLTKSVLLVPFLGRKCEILAKSHNSLKCLNVQKRPISQLVLITDIFTYKTVQFGECRPNIN